MDRSSEEDRNHSAPPRHRDSYRSRAEHADILASPCHFLLDSILQGTPKVHHDQTRAGERSSSSISNQRGQAPVPDALSMAAGAERNVKSTKNDAGVEVKKVASNPARPGSLAGSGAVRSAQPVEEAAPVATAIPAAFPVPAVQVSSYAAMPAPFALTPQGPAVAFYQPQFGAAFSHPVALSQQFYAFSAPTIATQLQAQALLPNATSTDIPRDVPSQASSPGRPSPSPSTSFQSQFFANLPSPAMGAKSAGVQRSSSSSQPQPQKRRTSSSGGLGDDDDLDRKVEMATRRDEDGDTCLHLAVVQAHRPMSQHIINLLRQRHIGVDIQNNLHQTPFHLAVIIGHVPLVEDLIAAGADPNRQDRKGRTAAHLCAIHHCRGVLNYLGKADMDKDAPPASKLSTRGKKLDTELKDFEGFAPIHTAVLHDDGRIVNILLEMGADIDSKDGTAGRSALHHAVECCRLPLIRYLLDAGASVNAINYSGSSPLHTAAGREHREAVSILMSHGADATLMNSEGDTPKDLCRDKQVRHLMMK